ncbi:MAG TPA: DegV family protein [Gemmatimonadota bacterium]|nr:DegV family protein [Gemmatimonadota bacterium]
MVAVRYLDGTRLRRAAAAAARWVSQRQENLNGINVFPVPDGDTGTNLAATLVSAAERAQRVRERSVGAVSRALADGALFGACGNSGAILAQFFEGFASSLEGRQRATGPTLAEAVTRASEAAHDALARPREGTILTVMRVWAAGFRSRTSREGTDLLEAFRASLDTAREALARTPDQLRELARAGVVDAGAQGFVYFLEGMLHFAEGRLAGSVVEEGHATALEHASVEEAPQDIGLRFCTECMIEGEGLDVAGVRDAVAMFGDSLVVAGSPRRIRVHIHTDRPDRVFEIAAGFGRVATTKADDMRAQHVARFDRGRVAVVTDSAADIPERILQRLRIHTVPLRVLLGPSVYLDKQTVNPDEVYDRLTRGETAVRTSQPAPGDYAALYSYLFEHYGALVVPSLSGALSGTLEAARRATALADPARIHLVDTRSASIGQGLVVHAAAERAAAGGTPEEVAAAAEEARGRVRLYVAVPTVDYLRRGGRLAGWKARIAERLGLVPLLTIDPASGSARLLRLARRGKVHRATLALAIATLRREPSPPERVWIAHAAAAQAADAFRQGLAKVAPDAEIEIVEVGPALGAHTGPGAVAVAFLSRR